MQARVRYGIKHDPFPKGAFHPVEEMTVQLDNHDTEVPEVWGSWREEATSCLGE